MRLHILVIGICFIGSGCGMQPLPGEISKDRYFEEGVEARKRSKGEAPELGLALAGGGIKAADFSIGVLQGLIEAGVMERVDAVSTVSGGGYAALWYFSRLLNPAEYERNSLDVVDYHKFARMFFADCIPIKYKDLNYVNPLWHKIADPTSGICPKNMTNFAPDDPEQKAFNSDPVRYQNHLRGYQDIFAWNWRRPFHYEETTSDQGRRNVKIEFTGSFALTALSSIVNFVPNVLFDWEVPVSSSRNQYRAGILRAFGATPTNCEQTGGCVFSTRPVGSEAFVRDDLTFKLLRQEYEKGIIPLWIINATAGENRDLFSAIAHPGQKPLQLTSFEFSPYGSGSGLFQYSRQSLDDLRPWEAVTVSAAFLDAQQKVYPVWWNIGMNVTTLNWGRSHRNPHVQWVETILHKALPAPLYLFHRRSGDSAGDFVNIRLSDGGQSEDLGAYALIHRKLPDIIVSDHSSDRSGRMDDVCRLKNGLAKDRGDDPHLYVYFPGLSNLDEVCIKDSNLGYDIFNWEHPIVLGCVTSDRDNYDCVRKQPMEQDHFQHIYLIKPSFPGSESRHHLARTLLSATRECGSRKGKDNCADAVSSAPRFSWTHHWGILSPSLMEVFMAKSKTERGRFSSRKKMEVVLRVLRGDDLDVVSREAGITAATVSEWRDQFVASGQAGLKSRAAEGRDDELVRLKALVGDLTMRLELSREAVQRLRGGVPLATGRSTR
ncbi:MAG: hypothetical protein Nkreftii_002751 [Candidatus Nitrospira kreftii]|uniref:PNPLA domain-containing protein n=2 Tax=Candidatus Nitrospira kreftii TaxID=2652173 RepID=A0A7S8FFK7_9BACT|nr:MAG: hypothetical protein Nkreftii_002751 [Candidatus Nitrospira kreftii]